ncbi:MAG: L-2-amino-thiazoline-4-carboxylic acid hydrolase [Candidatus Schekmanbacteria bacterium]|nr:L-2-amino-thiazoline-4-carboxylic acid hydrolase [Candidatus Schekmanbacteria bacterium]
MEEKIVGKDFPWEKQREMLIERVSMKLPQLYQNLVATYGPEKGRKVYDDIFEVNFVKRSKVFFGKDIGDIMMAEVDIFPAMGWKIWIDKKDEADGPAWYEHLELCPHWESTKKHKLPDPCDLVCNMDCKMGQKYKVGNWERLKHMPSGDSECLFRITRAK